jgi:hypothetical protein
MNPLTGRFMSRDPNEPQVRDALGWPIDPKALHKYLYAGGDPVNRLDPSGRADLAEVDLENAQIKFTSHGLAHLVAEGAPATQAEVESLIEAIVRQFIADMQAAGSNLTPPFDLIFNSPLLQDVPWIIRVFIVSAVDIRISTYAPKIF